MLAASVKHHFEVRTRVGFTGAIGGRAQGATLIMINERAIPCSAPGFGDKDMVVATMALIAPLTEGMARAPFKYNDKSAKQAPTKPLTAFDADGNMQFWSYLKKGTDKGERQEDASWRMRPGATYKFFFRRDDVEKKGDRVALAMPSGVDEIPPFTLCEVTVVPKSTGPCSEGWGLTVKSVRISPLSLYSYASKLVRFAGSRDDARRAMLEAAATDECVRRHIESENPCFVTAVVNSDAFTTVDEALGIVKLRNYANNMTDVDLDIDALKRYTNTSTVESACRLLEIAIALRAVRVFVFSSTWRARKSGLSECFGIPVLDTEKLLAAAVTSEPEPASDDEEQLSFTALTDASMFAPGAALTLTVGRELTALSRSGAPPTSDLILTESRDVCERAFPVEFRLSDEESTVIWRGHFNTTPLQADSNAAAGAGGALPVRRKWESLE